MRTAIPKKELSLKRKFLREESRKWPAQMMPVPRDQWPHDRDGKVVSVFRSRAFLVQVYTPEGGATRLSVCRTELDNCGDWKDGIAWEELQRIKAECGFGNRFAVEVFPTDDNVVNVANMRHLWVLEAPLAFAWAMKEAKP